MAIYDIRGNNMLNAYSYNGMQIETAYNYNGLQIFPDSDYTITVMSYNVGSFYSEYIPTPEALSNVFYERNNNIFSECNAQIAGLTEYYKKIGYYNSETLLNSFFPFSYIDFIPYPTDEAGFCISLYTSGKSENIVRYTAQGGQDRYYKKTYINYKNKKICVALTHLDLNFSIRSAQILEFLSALENEEYFIAMGDFNFSIENIGDTQYNASIQEILNRGFNSAQNNSEILYTHYNGTTIENSTRILALDNIFTSSNITINNVRVNTLKLTDGLCEQYDILIDHLPLLADIEIH